MSGTTLKFAPLALPERGPEDQNGGITQQQMQAEPMRRVEAFGGQHAKVTLAPSATVARAMEGQMRRIRLVALIGVCAMTFGCDQGHHFPNMSVVPKGSGFQGTESFSTEKMLSLCAAANASAEAGELSRKTDREIADGTCEVSAIAVELIGRGDDPVQTCVAAEAVMIKEFNRRFPDHDPKDVIGRC